MFDGQINTEKKSSKKPSATRDPRFATRASRLPPDVAPLAWDGENTWGRGIIACDAAVVFD